MRKGNSFWAMIFIFILSCTATVPMATDSSDAKGKLFTPEPNKANIYLVRSETLNSSAMFRAVLDGKIIGAIGPDTYLLLSINPGEHALAVHSINNSEMVKFTAAAGKNYFFDVKWEIGWSNPRVSFKQIAEEEGRKQVMKTERAATMVY